MNRSKLFALVALATPVLVASCGPSGEANGAQPAAEQQPAPPTRIIDVETAVVEPREFVEYVAVTGAVAADREVVVSSEEAGVIREVFVDKGARVSAGQPIAKIDDAVLSAQYAQAQAEADLAAETWERQRRLWEEDSIGSEIAYLRAKLRIGGPSLFLALAADAAWLAVLLATSGTAFDLWLLAGGLASIIATFLQLSRTPLFARRI